MADSPGLQAFEQQGPEPQERSHRHSNKGTTPTPSKPPIPNPIAKFALVSAGVFLLLLIFILLLPREDPKTGAGGADGGGGGGSGAGGLPYGPAEKARRAHEEAKRRVDTALGEFDGQRHPSPSGAWETAIIYGILVDRFNNGDRSNDENNLMPWDKEARKAGDYQELGKMRHGGDLRGIIWRLPYIRELGANTILLSPVLSHNGHYDGSCTMDPTRIDSGFGTKEEFRDLVAEAHNLQIRVVMDVVLNHLCDPNVHYGASGAPKESRQVGDDKVRQCSVALMEKYTTGNSEVDNGAQMELDLDNASYAGFRGMPHFFNRCGPGTKQKLATMEAVALFADTGENMFDFDTSNSDWQELFLDIHKFWIAYADIDGFHCSGAEHVTEDFLAYFATNLRRFAKEKAGKDNFLVVGDVKGKDWAAKRIGLMQPESQGQTVKKMLEKLKSEQPGFSAVHNLQQNDVFRGQLTGESDEGALLNYYDEDALALAKLLVPKCDEEVIGCGAALSKYWTGLERAPLPRFASARASAPDGFSEVGLAMLLLAPGRPIINYGQEQGFNGRCPGAEVPACSDAEALERSRQDMFKAGHWRLGSSVGKINSLAGVTQPGSGAKGEVSADWESDPMLDRSHELYLLAQGLTRLRVSCPALLRGTTLVRDVEEHRKGGAIAFSRVIRGDKAHAMEVIVVVNPHPGDANFSRIPCDDDINEDMFDYDEVRSELVEKKNDLEESEEDHVRYMHGHCFLVFPGHGLQVPEFSFKVLVRKDQLAPKREEGLPLRLCRPAPPEGGEEQPPAGGGGEEEEKPGGGSEQPGGEGTKPGGGGDDPGGGQEPPGGKTPGGDVPGGDEEEPDDGLTPPDEEEPGGGKEPEDGQEPGDAEKPVDGDEPPADGGGEAPADGQSWSGWARERLAVADEDFQRSGAARQPSPPSWESSVIYSILVDRFNNADPKNDEANLMDWDRAARESEDFSQIGRMRHGGDLVGIQRRLSYIQALGANTILISPVLSHSGYYDGSCLKDPRTIDPGFGTNEEFRQLVASAHEMGIRVIMDIVVNHLCDPKMKYKRPRAEGAENIEKCTREMFDIHLKGQGEVETYGLQLSMEFSEGSLGAFSDASFFNRCGPGDEYQLQNDDAAVLFADVQQYAFDFNTRDAKWQELFTDMHKWWIAYADVDGFHCHGAEHVTEDFLAYFATEARGFAASLGKDNFYVVGEVTGKDEWAIRRVGAMNNAMTTDPTAVGETAHPVKGKTLEKMMEKLEDKYRKHRFGKPGLNSVRNWAQSSLLREELKGDEVAEMVEKYFSEGDGVMSDLASQVAPACKEQKDCTAALPGFWTEMENAYLTRYAADGPNTPKFDEVGLAVLLLAPGQPMINYGQELGFNGACPENAGELCSNAAQEDKWQQDMFLGGPWCLGSSVPSIGKTAHVGPFDPEVIDTNAGVSWDEDQMLQRSHELFRWAQGLIRLRLTCPAISRGATIVRQAHGAEEDGGLAFSRVLRGDRKSAMEVIVVVNPGNKETLFHKIACDPEINENSAPYDEIRSTHQGVKESEEHMVRYEDTKHCFLVFAGEGLKVEAFSFKVFVRKDQLEEKANDLLPCRLCKHKGNDIPDIPPSLRGIAEGSLRAGHLRKPAAAS